MMVEARSIGSTGVWSSRLAVGVVVSGWRVNDHDPISRVSAVIEWLGYHQAIYDVMGRIRVRDVACKSEGGVLDSMKKMTAGGVEGFIERIS